MIFQDPYSSLNPVRTVDATLREALAVSPDPRTTVADLLARVGLRRTLRGAQAGRASGGERQRVAVARALALQPRLIVCDEPVSALDVSVQAQILNLFASLREELGLGYLFITHDLAVVRQVVERVYVLYRGEIVESGGVDRVLDSPQHPYTGRLVESVPRTDPGWLAPLGLHVAARVLEGVHQLGVLAPGRATDGALVHDLRVLAVDLERRGVEGLVRRVHVVDLDEDGEQVAVLRVEDVGDLPDGRPRCRASGESRHGDPGARRTSRVVARVFPGTIQAVDRTYGMDAPLGRCEYNP